MATPPMVKEKLPAVSVIRIIAVDTEAGRADDTLCLRAAMLAVSFQMIAIGLKIKRNALTSVVCASVFI